MQEFGALPGSWELLFRHLLNSASHLLHRLVVAHKQQQVAFLCVFLDYVQIRQFLVLEDVYKQQLTGVPRDSTTAHYRSLLLKRLLVGLRIRRVLR